MHGILCFILVNDSHINMSIRRSDTNTHTHTLFLARESVCVCALREVSFAGRNSHPARPKQRPLVMLDAGVQVTEGLSRGERKPGESKITSL